VALESKSATSRQVKNKLAKWLITLGGISVLFTLVLIFMYLLYVIKPIFESAKIESQVVIKTHNTQPILVSGVDELKEIGYQINTLGQFNFYSFIDKNVTAPLLTEDALEDEQLAFIIQANYKQNVLVNTDGGAKITNVNFKASYHNDTRELTPSVVYPLGEESIVIDEQAQPILKTAFAMNDERAIFVALTADHRLIKTTLVAEDDFSDDPSYEAIYQEIDFAGKNIDDILITPDLAMTFIRTGNQISIFELDDDSDVPLKTSFIPASHGEKVTSIALLSGGSSLLIGHSNGTISQWFEVNSKDGRSFQQIRSFDMANNAPVVQLYSERFRRSFYAVNNLGETNLFYTTSDAKLWQGKLAEDPIQAFSIAPRADGLVVSHENTFELFSVHNEHPEVTWHALWEQVWYEGYPEPQYTWQSTSGSDDFEAKFSLVPISFGTLKAAIYAMIFAMPMALAAAIYTAYFMTPALRKKVKPTIEMMEALPTVILGFLAGLWLAPLIEKFLPAVFLLLILCPLSIFIVAYAWNKLPKQLKTAIPETWAPIILIPFLILAGYSAFALSPIIEQAWFGGDMRQYITNTLGINFDQRNALVVGIAMGFAVIPTIFSIAEDAIFSVPKQLTSGSLALGATPWQTLIKVVLLTASPGIFSAVMMGLGRAVGETMIVLMATGNTPILDWNIFEGMRTLAANIAVEMPESEVGSSHYRILFLAAFVLFVFTFIFNTAAEFIRQRLREKYSSL
jgi:phosphate transport system permease protein